MKILHICQRDNPDIGGSLRVAEGLAHVQRAGGDDVWLLFLYGKPANLSEEFSPDTVCLELDSSRQFLKGWWRLRKALRQIKPDVIHSHDGILWPRLAYLGSGNSVVTHAHLPAGDPSWIKQLLGWPLIKNTTNSLIGISEHTIESWEAAGYPSNRTHYVPNGVDLDRFTIVDDQKKKVLRQQLDLPVDRRIVAWVGRLHREVKGTDRVEYIAEHLPADVTIVVVGIGTEYEAMVERCKDLIRQDRILFVGSSTHPEDYYQAADAYLFSSYREAFGLVTLEAVACGLPILAFPVHDGKGATALLKEFEAVEIEDHASEKVISDAFEELFSRSGNTAHLREKAADKYSWSAISRQVMDVYESVVNMKAERK